MLMDMQMPILDGYGAAAQIKAMGVSVPMIALTANAMDGDRDRCLKAGCYDYVTKPVRFDHLIEVCARWKRMAA